MRNSNDRLYAFSGLMYSGKDFVAKYSKLNVASIAEPIYELCDYFNSTRNKSVPGIRRWMQLIGQWGWGHVDEEYLVNVERGVITDLIRRFGKQMTKNFGFVDWTEFGKRNDFWINILLLRTGLTGTVNRRLGQLRLFESGTEDDPLNIAVTNARFDHELSPLVNAGFSHYHVRCTEESRRERMLQLGYQVKETDANDHSEQMAIRLNADMPDHRVIWNDHRPMPEGRQFLSLDAFMELSIPKVKTSLVFVPKPADQTKMALA
jgi:hypothetical protein